MIWYKWRRKETDCLLGGKGKLLEIDPDHKYLCLNPAFIQFDEKLREKPKYRTWGREMYSMLDGIILLDAMGDLAAYQARIDEIEDRTGLPILDNRKIGLDGLRDVLLEALDRKLSWRVAVHPSHRKPSANCYCPPCRIF